MLGWRFVVGSSSFFIAATSDGDACMDCGRSFFRGAGSAGGSLDFAFAGGQEGFKGLSVALALETGAVVVLSGLEKEIC